MRRAGVGACLRGESGFKSDQAFVYPLLLDIGDPCVHCQWKRLLYLEDPCLLKWKKREIQLAMKLIPPTNASVELCVVFSTNTRRLWDTVTASWRLFRGRGGDRCILTVDNAIRTLQAQQVSKARCSNLCSKGQYIWQCRDFHSSKREQLSLSEAAKNSMCTTTPLPSYYTLHRYSLSF